MTGKELRALREDLGLTQQQLADLTQVQITTVRKHERGEWPISKGMINIYYAVEERVMRKRIRWIAAGKKPGKGWTQGPWATYSTEDQAKEAADAYTEIAGKPQEAVPVLIRTKLAEYPEREDWQEARLILTEE